jgi:hypothetical protein
MDAFQTAASGFSILKHFMSIIGVLSQSLLLCWLGERHIQQVTHYKCNHLSNAEDIGSLLFHRMLLMIYITSHLHLILS